jgi:hypothetical protein
LLRLPALLLHSPLPRSSELLSLLPLAVLPPYSLLLASLLASLAHAALLSLGRAAHAPLGRGRDALDNP